MDRSRASLLLVNKEASASGSACVSVACVSVACVAHHTGQDRVNRDVVNTIRQSSVALFADAVRSRHTALFIFVWSVCFIIHLATP